MQVQKGLVKYKDRSDILCTYGITDEGKTYYFLEGNTIPNGNIVATTVLVEAIDPLVMSSSIGVIDPNGNVVIPFENKAIKTIANDLLLVEKATPVTESVIEAIELRSDPQAASRLVTTPAVIKENMNAKMGSEGRFVFNDQFSEATICDMNGQNLVNGELYSFVGVTQDKLYLSKNTAESFISEFELGAKKLVLTPEMNDPMLKIGTGDASEFTVDLDTVQQNAEQAALDAEAATVAAMNEAVVAMQEDEALRNAPPEPVEQTAVEPASEVPAETASVDVPTENNETIEPMTSENTEGGFMPDDITAENFADIAAATDLNIGVTQEENATGGESVTEEQTSVETAPLTSLSDETSSEAPKEENTEAPKEENTEGVTEETNTDGVVEVSSQQETTEEVAHDDSVKVISSEEVKDVVESSEPSTEFKLDFDTPVEDASTDLFSDNTSMDLFEGASLKVDQIVEDEEETNALEDFTAEYNFGYLPGHASKDDISREVAETLNQFVNITNDLKKKLAIADDRNQQLTDAYKKIGAKLQEAQRENERIKAANENYKTLNSKLDSKVEILQAKIVAFETKQQDQARTIRRLGEENQSLRRQSLNNDAIVDALRDARSVLGGFDDYGDSDRIGYYKKAA